MDTGLEIGDPTFIIHSREFKHNLKYELFDRTVSIGVYHTDCLVGTRDFNMSELKLAFEFTFSKTCDTIRK